MIKAKENLHVTPEVLEAFRKSAFIEFTYKGVRYPDGSLKFVSIGFDCTGNYMVKIDEKKHLFMLEQNAINFYNQQDATAYYKEQPRP